MEKYSKIIWDSGFGYELGLYIGTSTYRKYHECIYLLTGVVYGLIHHQTNEVKEYSTELHEKLKTKYNRHKEFPIEIELNSIINKLMKRKNLINEQSLPEEPNLSELNEHEYKVIVSGYGKDKGAIEFDEITIKSGLKIKYAPLGLDNFMNQFEVGQEAKLTMVGGVLPRISKFNYKINPIIVGSGRPTIANDIQDILNEKNIQSTVVNNGYQRTSKITDSIDKNKLTLCYDKNINGCYNKIELIFTIGEPNKTELKIVYHQSNIIKKIKYDGYCNNVKYLQDLIENIKIN